MLGAIDRIGLDKNKITVVSGIGCSSRATGYVDFNTLHTTHGRAIAFATGVKFANPELTVLVVTGDGDATAIGGNHFIHAARRNIDITVILYNNWIYGMTGGQVSPTTPHGMRATTAPFGNPEGSFDISRLAIAAGASFVARGSVTSPVKLSQYIEKGIRKKGFALIEAFTPCPTAFGRQNKMGKAIDNLEWIEERTVDVKKAAALSPEELEDKLVTGILVDVEKAEYTELYDKLVENVRDKPVDLHVPEREVVLASIAVAGGEEL
ncbi:MAG: 2-oxoacid:ferredoxin oxidoreductase subunit beta [Candidatus Eisenbacteria bacterium]|nr:2-oxoacid:ferredoxin oxidoreductase subunit beta [Candidatus Eisenbacteria bacterium]